MLGTLVSLSLCRELAPVLAALMDWAAPTQGMRVVDVGCGAGLLAGLLWLVHNTQVNMAARGIQSGWDFLGQTAGFDIGEQLIAFDAGDSLARAFLVGLLNTLRVALLGIVLCTLLGTLIGLGRLSHNLLLRALCDPARWKGADALLDELLSAADWSAGADGGAWSVSALTPAGGLSLRLRTDALVPWTRWITPRQASVTHKRFDTRFFITRVPEGQTAEHDNHETTEILWTTPRNALIQYWHGQIVLAPPQIMSLSHLCLFNSVEQALQEAAQRTPPVIMPEPFDQEGMRVICYPGDPRHPVAARALPGPSRLHFRNKRFEPEGGLEALLHGPL